MDSLSSPDPQDDFPARLAAAQRGDSDALDQLCSQLYPAVSRIVHRSLSADFRLQHPWLGGVFSTGDIVQDVFMGVISDLPEFRGQTEGSLVHYLATLTKNRLIDTVRFYEASRRDRRRVREDVEQAKCEPGQIPAPEDQAIAAEEMALVHHALMAFGERDRNLLRERFENDTPFEELSQMLGYASADSARKAFSSARVKLALRIQRMRGA